MTENQRSFDDAKTNYSDAINANGNGREYETSGVAGQTSAEVSQPKSLEDLRREREKIFADINAANVEGRASDELAAWKKYEDIQNQIAAKKKELAQIEEERRHPKFKPTIKTEVKPVAKAGKSISGVEGNVTKRATPKTETPSAQNKKSAAQPQSTESQNESAPPKRHKYFRSMEETDRELYEAFGITPPSENQNAKSTVDDNEEMPKFVDYFDDSDENLARLEDELQKELGKISANAVFNPKIWTLGLEIGGIYIQRGINKFADWAKRITNSFGEYGEESKIWQPAIWETLKTLPRDGKFNSNQQVAIAEKIGSLFENGTTDYNEIESYIIDRINVEGIEPLIKSTYDGIKKFFDENVSTQQEETPADKETVQDNSAQNDATELENKTKDAVVSTEPESSNEALGTLPVSVSSSGNISQSESEGKKNRQEERPTLEEIDRYAQQVLKTVGLENHRPKKGTGLGKTSGELNSDATLTLNFGKKFVDAETFTALESIAKEAGGTVSSEKENVSVKFDNIENLAVFSRAVRMAFTVKEVFRYVTIKRLQMLKELNCRKVTKLKRANRLLKVVTVTLSLMRTAIKI